MAISNVSNGFRPGVCTYSTRPVSPYNGQVIYETDTKQTLVYQGSSWVMLTDADTPPGLELVKSQTIGSAVSTETVSNCFSSGYDSYRIVVTASSASGDGNNVYYKQNGSTGSTYNANGFFMGIGSSTVSGFNNNASSAGIHIALTGTTFWSSSFDVHNPFATARTTVVAQGAGSGYFTTTGGYDSNAASSTGFTFTLSAGTITGGTIRVYGYRNAI
jgi:hypothetical protein